MVERRQKDLLSDVFCGVPFYLTSFVPLWVSSRRAICGDESFGGCCASKVVGSAHEERAINDRPDP